MEAAIEEEYEITIGPRLGPGPADAKEARALNRVVRWRDGQIEYEADPRQTERLIAECGLENCRTTATPGVRASLQELEADVPLPDKLHTAFRGPVARGNYLSTDRLDCHFACEETSKNNTELLIDRQLERCQLGNYVSRGVAPPAMSTSQLEIEYAPSAKQN